LLSIVFAHAIMGLSMAACRIFYKHLISSSAASLSLQVFAVSKTEHCSM